MRFPAGSLARAHCRPRPAFGINYDIGNSASLDSIRPGDQCLRGAHPQRTSGLGARRHCALGTGTPLAVFGAFAARYGGNILQIARGRRRHGERS
jgi:hypothetical protein